MVFKQFEKCPHNYDPLILGIKTDKQFSEMFCIIIFFNNYPKGKIKSYYPYLQTYTMWEINQNLGNVHLIMSPGLAIAEPKSL